MPKNDAESKGYRPKLERRDTLALRKRAAEDAAEDADSYASKSWAQGDKAVGSTGLGQIAELFCPERGRVGEGSRDGIDGLVLHSAGGVTSDDLLEIFLAAQAEVLAVQSIRIFRDNISWSGKYVDWMMQVL